MSNELCAYLPAGLTLYAVLLDGAGKVWDGSEFVTIDADDWADYDIALSEATAGIYQGAMPLVEGGSYTYPVYEQAGGAPAITDTLKGSGSILWDGNSEIIPAQYGDPMGPQTAPLNVRSHEPANRPTH